MHIADLNVGELGANGIVGGGIPHAVGAGLGIKLNGINSVAVSFFGDGASNQQNFHEGINLAAIWKLPVIFICENNQYQVSLSYSEQQIIKSVAERGKAYGIPGVSSLPSKSSYFLTLGISTYSSCDQLFEARYGESLISGSQLP